MTERFALPGTHRVEDRRARVIGTPPPSEVVDVTLVLRRRSPIGPRDVAPPMNRLAFAAAHGADVQDVRAVEAFAHRFNLTVTAADLARRAVVLTGSIAALAEAFGATLRLYQSERGTYRGRTGEIYLPSELEGIVVAVFGLDDRPQAMPRFRRRPLTAPRGASEQAFSPVEVASLYGMPAGTGAGETIALIELGGGFSPLDLGAYFDGLGITPPSVTAVAVSGARNEPTGDPNGPDGEVLLDIEVSGAIAPDARVVVYFAPNTDKGFFDAITTALHDHIRHPSIVSISWGGPEAAWTKQALHAYDDAFQDAAALGITVCCAAGDNGSSDGVDDGRSHVDFPASSPHVLACGGTRLEVEGQRIRRELVWNESTGGATGGGVSEFFSVPDYQQHVHVPASPNAPHFRGRGVPDVSANADPFTGYRVRIDGHDTVVGGTSAVAPLWAAIIARRNALTGRALGYANPVLYSSAPAEVFGDVTSGTNGAFAASAGWDPCTGLGSPRGGKFWRQPSVPA